jgi:type IV secretory pathway TraG/TraD family ATPase VirD4
MKKCWDSRRNFEGFETWTTAFKMRSKMCARILLALLVVQTIAFLINVHVTTGYGAIGLYFKMLYHSGWDFSYTGPAINRLFINWVILFIAIIVIPYPAVLYIFKIRSDNQSSKKYIRGARLIPTGELNRRMRKRKVLTYLPLGSIRMPLALENRQTCIIGLTGTGKSQCFRKIIKSLYERGNKGIIHDPKGEYFSEFFNKKRDLLFNPLDTRSLGWNVFYELNSYPDVDAVAASLIPPASGSDSFWNDAARGVFSGILHFLYQNKKCTNQDLWSMLTTEAKDISKKLKQTKGGEAGLRYITLNARNSKQAESVLAVMMQYTKCFEYMANCEGDFRVTRWLKDDQPGMIYVTNYKDIEETLRPILSLFIDLISRKLLSMPDDLNRRIFVLLDEFGSLQRLSSIVNLLTEGRSKGACCFLGVQDDGQIEKIYSQRGRKTIDNACANRITFALAGETAEKEAKYNIGEVEFSQFRRSYSMGPTDLRDGIGLSEEHKRDLMLLSSDIANLKDLSAIVRLRNYDFTVSNWQWEKAKQMIDRFILRDDLLLENIVKDALNTKNSAMAGKPSLNISAT